MHNNLVNELAVCGLNAVKAVAEYHPQAIKRLFLRDERLSSFRFICKQLAENKKPYKICEDEELEQICKSRHHEGVVAMIEEPFVEPLSRDDLALWHDEGKTGIVLHSVGNDHNLGAIVRSAAFFDVHFVIISELDNDARLSTGAYRVAEGGMEHIVIRSVKRTEAFLREASGKLWTIGTDTRARLRISDLSKLIKKDPAEDPPRSGVALVVGNETAGLPEAVKAQCGALLRIPGTGNIESLNVAQAATLFLHEIYEL
jgi:TrmH RNA methyltransferase